MDKEEIKKTEFESIEETIRAWNEFFKDKPEPKNDEEDKKQQEEFYYWYNYVRKQRDTGKTPAEMYKETYGKEPPQNLPINSEEISRMINFEWGEDENDEPDDEGDEDEQMLSEATELADYMFDSSVWTTSKERLRDMSRREVSKHMFRLGFFMHAKYIGEQMETLAKEFQGKSKEEIDKIIENLKKDKWEKRDDK